MLRLVGGELLDVGGVGSRDIADGGHSHSDLVGGGHDGVAHEVAVDPILGKGAGELVVGPGEVVETDEGVAGFDKLAGGAGEERELLPPAGQLCLVELFLVRFDPRDVGVGETGDPVGCELGDHRTDAVSEARLGLERADHR